MFAPVRYNETLNIEPSNTSGNSNSAPAIGNDDKQYKEEKVREREREG